MVTMRISQLAEATGVPATTLRYYEGAGLLPAARTASGYRVYDHDAIGRLNFIGAAKHLGLPLEEIAELLAAWAAGPDGARPATRQAFVADRISDAQDRIRELQAFVATLQHILAHIDTPPAAPPAVSPG